MSTYLDTSALAKWYFPESGSEEFEAWFTKTAELFSSTLVRLEFQSLVARRKRMKELTTSQVAKILAAFDYDTKSGSIVLRTVSDAHIVNAKYVLDRCPGVALRTLDALHLSIALDNHATELATGDIIMTEAAKELGLATRFYGPRPTRSARRK